MTPSRVHLVVALAGALAGSTAHAQSFEADAGQATAIHRLDELVWVVTAACDQGDDVQQRQCRLVRDHRAQELAGVTLLVDGEVAALEVGKWNAQKKSIGLAVSACIRCTGLEVDGKRWHVVGTGAAPRVDAGRVRAPLLHDTTERFADEAEATAWAKTLTNARVQYLVKLPARPRWSVGGKLGLALDVVGYRVIAPCTGAVIAAKPPAASIPADKNACGAAPADPDAQRSEGRLPDGLTGMMIKDTMQPVLDAANACFARYRASGRAKLELVVAASGEVTSYQQLGDFLGTPTATCIDTAMKKIRFPATQKPSTKIGFPVVLQ